MALPILAVAAAVKILGPAAAKAAKLAYKMYKKKGGKKTEQKFLSDKANAKNKASKNESRKINKQMDKDAEQAIIKRQKETMGKDKKTMLAGKSKADAKHLKKDKFPGLARKDKQMLKKEGAGHRYTFGN